MIAAFRNYNHINCVNHLIHNTLQKAIDEEADTLNLQRSCTKLVKYFKKSGLNSKLDTTLKSFSPTRWNTIYYELLSIEMNWTDIMQILKEKNELHRLNQINLNILTPIVKILKEFEKTSKILEGDKYPTLHLTYVYVNNLKKKCRAESTDIPIIKTFKENLIKHIDSVIISNLKMFHKIALFLFPPFNKLIIFSPEEKENIKYECKNIMESYKEFGESNVGNQSEMCTEMSNEYIDLFSDFLPNTLNRPEDQINFEISSYENENVQFHDNFDVLKWWDMHKNQYPLLYKTSCKILATPASSASSERTFSVARNLINEKRSNISYNDETVNKMMFLRSNICDSLFGTED